MKTKIEVRYCWKVLSEEGHLSDPKTSWGDHVFSSFGYLTREEAIEQLKFSIFNLRGQDPILLETYTEVTDWDDNG